MVISHLMKEEYHHNPPLDVFTKLMPPPQRKGLHLSSIKALKKYHLQKDKPGHSFEFAGNKSPNYLFRKFRLKICLVTYLILKVI